MSGNYTHEEREEIQKRLTELVRKNGRMTFGELRRVTGLTVFTARHYLERGGTLWGSVSGGQKWHFSIGARLPDLEAKAGRRQGGAFPECKAGRWGALRQKPEFCL